MCRTLILKQLMQKAIMLQFTMRGCSGMCQRRQICSWRRLCLEAIKWSNANEESKSLTNVHATSSLVSLCEQLLLLEFHKLFIIRSTLTRGSCPPSLFDILPPSLGSCPIDTLKADTESLLQVARDLFYTLIIVLIPRSSIPEEWQRP